MTLRQFEVFLAITRAGSFHRAAETLHLSQPALSQHVRELETALGARLFDRLAPRVAPTDAGRMLAEHVTRLFVTLADARQAIHDLQGPERGPSRSAPAPRLVFTCCPDCSGHSASSTRASSSPCG